MTQPPANSDSATSAAQLRRSIYWLLIAVAIGQATGRVLAINSTDVEQYDRVQLQKNLDKPLADLRAKLTAQGIQGEELLAAIREERKRITQKYSIQRPFLSANDRSRWVTVRALVEDGTYAIDQIVTDKYESRRWDTIDMIKHYGRDLDDQGRPRAHLYSSKPPLMATMVAGPYWVIHKLTGLSLRDDDYVVVRTLLILCNVIPLGIFLVMLAALVERYGTTTWGRLLVMATGAFGSFLTTFSVVLNNHTTAAIFVLAAIYALLRVWHDGRRELRYFVVAGLFSALAAAFELPALSFYALLAAALLWKAPRQSMLAFAPASLVVAAAFFGTNYAAHNTFLPAYGYRTPGQDWTNGNWYEYTYEVDGKEKTSYWSYHPDAMKRRSAIDRGEPSRAKYALHALVGHHGIFSLTPIWLLSLAGVTVALAAGRRTGSPWLELALMTAALSIVCIGFYLMQGQENRNYGGATSGLRWAFWLTPLWLLAMLPAADWTDRGRVRRGLAAVLLILSVMSASYPVWNPWTSPWPVHLMEHVGWRA